jgi:hypothetical protein
VRYNIFRWYRAAWGRYTQADPTGLNDGPNLYSYVRGRPTYYVDPVGLASKKCQKCDQCPSGVWRWDGVARTAGGGGLRGGTTTWGTLCCRNAQNPMTPGPCIKVKVECTWAGIMLGAGAGISGPVGSKPNECGCNEKDLLGEQPSSWVGEAGPVSVETGPCSTDESRRTYAVGVSLGLGAGFARQECFVKRDE